MQKTLMDTSAHNRKHVISIISVNFIETLQSVKELQTKNHFWDIEKGYNSVKANQNLPMNNPNCDIPKFNAHAKSE